MERDTNDDAPVPTGSDDADAQALIDSWGTEVESKGLTNEQWEQQVTEYRSRDTEMRWLTPEPSGDEGDE